jgi:hypothetical protein
MLSNIADKLFKDEELAEKLQKVGRIRGNINVYARFARQQ